ncbi:hypothetical protein JCM30237_25700 [Halolamina litorea]|uniref:ArsR family transcriptional regulator n=1 Tax=Halolamina litorea TaxID=1515593 RepID=A0ABD6BV35_9EURY|nr:hypothetical protein [Halolamina litorea]
MNVEAPAAEESTEPSLDIIFEMLRNRRRQLVLEFLRDREETVTIGELAEHIAAIENDTTVRQLNAQQRKRVYIGLYQCHLPKMDDVDVIDFNQSRGRIEPGEHIEPLYEYLDVANGENEEEAEEAKEQPFDRRYGAGYLAFTSVFFAAQLSGAHVIASAAVVLLLAITVATTY